MSGFDGGNLFEIDLSTGKRTRLGQDGNADASWSGLVAGRRAIFLLLRYFWGPTMQVRRRGAAVFTFWKLLDHLIYLNYELLV